VTRTRDSEVPVKLYYRIGEVSELVGVEPHVLRYWESEFRAIRPQKSRRGQRVYSRKDVDKLLRVKELLYTHRFTIEGARKQLRDGGVEPAAPGDPAERAAVELRQALLSLRADIAAALASFDAEEGGAD
jgi:DNA-binding transcriptional MerR regulator